MPLLLLLHNRCARRAPDREKEMLAIWLRLLGVVYLHPPIPRHVVHNNSRRTCLRSRMVLSCFLRVCIGSSTSSCNPVDGTVRGHGGAACITNTGMNGLNQGYHVELSATVPGNYRQNHCRENQIETDTVVANDVDVSSETHQVASISYSGGVAQKKIPSQTSPNIAIPDRRLLWA